MIKKLPLAQAPIIGYHHHMFPLSVILNNNDNYPWFYSNYIQLQVDVTTMSPFNFTSTWYDKNPCFNIEIIRRETLTALNTNTIDFIISCIDKGKYIETNVDEYYISKSLFYKKKSWIHDIFIFGYNLDDKCLFVYRYDDKDKPSKYCMDFSEFEEAFSNTESKQNIHVLNLKDDIEYSFDIKWVSQQIEDYIYSRNTYDRFRMYMKPPENTIFGVDTYSWLIDYLNLIIIDKQKRLDIRPMHIFYEHKKCMSQRLKYMISENYLHDERIYVEYNKLERESFILRNMLIKYSSIKDEELIQRTIDKVKGICDCEIKILSELLLCIK